MLALLTLFDLITLFDPYRSFAAQAQLWTSQCRSRTVYFVPTDNIMHLF